MIGLSLILISLIFFNTDMPHLPYYTILPITGVSLVICFSNSYSGVGKILSNKLFVGTGLISYSLYLWHFPVLIFTKIFNGNFHEPLKAFTNITLLIIIFILSVATYFFIEKPFRNKKKISIYYFLVLVMGSILLILITCSIIIVNKGFIERNKITDTYILDSSYYHDENHAFELSINYNNTNGFVETSNSESTLKKKNVLIVGNSHAEDTYEIFYYNRNLFKNFNFALISPTSRTDDINYQVHCFYKLITKNLTLCDQYKYDGNTISQYKNSDIIIFSTKWAQKDVDILDKIIKILRQDKKKIIITNNIIESNVTGVFNGYRGLNLLDFFVFQKKRIPNDEELLKIEKKMYSFIKNMNLINEELKNIANNNNVKYLRKEDFLCNHQLRTCDLLTPDGYKIFWDDAHITKEGARYLGKKIHNINWFKF